MNMLSEELPDCICGIHNYGGGGGMISPGFANSNFICNECRRGTMVLQYGQHCSVLLADTMPAPKGDKVLVDYVNDILIPSLRASLEKGERASTPPQIPIQVTVMLRLESGWEKVDRDLSASLEIPPDPIRTKHDEYWGGLLKQLGWKDTAKEIPNRYYNDRNNNEPWYEVNDLNGRTIRFGPRKRVISIEMEAEKPFSCELISEAAKKDDTSYWNDDHWHLWDATTATKLCVHAWGKEKFIEYMGLIKRGLQAAEVPCSHQGGMP
jgi:hypothetical protein